MKTTTKKRKNKGISSIAQRRILVLNKSWQTIGTTTLEKAINKLFPKSGEPKAKIIDYDGYQTFSWEDWSKLKPKTGEDTIVTAKDIVRMPRIIQLTGYDKTHNKQVRFSRRVIFKRDMYLCQYCSKQLTSENATLDHVIPRSLGGLTTWENVVTSCVKCNSHKGSRLLKDCNMKLLNQPKKPKFAIEGTKYDIETWKDLISNAYWTVELENDNSEKED
jgi:hypothetical protein